MKKYLLDTNICIYAMRGKFNVAEKLMQVGTENCYISVITLAELEYGVENGSPTRRDEGIEMLEGLTKDLKVIPLAKVTPVFAKIKADLRRKGRMSEDFDVLIGARQRPRHTTSL